MDCQPLIDALPTLLGAIIGAAVSIVTTMMGYRYANEAEKQRRSDEHRRRMEEQQIENYEKLQEAVIEYARANIVEYSEIRRLYTNGVEHAELVTDDGRGEKLRLLQVKYSILRDRVLSDDVRSLAKKFDDAAIEMTVIARNNFELDSAFQAFCAASHDLSDAIGVELRKLLASETSTSDSDSKQASKRR